MIAKAMMPLKQYCDGNAFISNISNSRRDGTQSIKDDWYLNYLGNSAQKSVDNHKNGEKYISVNYENLFFKWWNQSNKRLLILDLAETLFREICWQRIFKPALVSLSCGNFKDLTSKRMRWILFKGKLLNFCVFKCFNVLANFRAHQGQDAGGGGGNLSRGKYKSTQL